MADVQKTLLIRHSVEQMYDLVTNVQDYPHFLPWCESVVIEHQDEEITRARVNIHFKGIRQYFETTNRQTRPHSIDMIFADGSFKSFTGYWRFTSLRADACKIEFALHYEFSNFIFEKMVSPVFNHIANTFVESFVARADDLFGKK